MILVVCTDDNDLLRVATQQSQQHPATFGTCHRVFDQVTPHLGVNENLFISAHGLARGDDGNPVIGDQRNAFFVNAVDLYHNISHIFPAQYTGSVYISACEAANIPRSAFSFAEAFKTQIHTQHGQTRVFGQRGSVGLRIPGPDDRGWVEA